MDPKALAVLKWTARIIALMMIALGLPFYLGYGNPLPFARPEYTVFDNLWLTAFPLMFIGLAVGWRYEKVGGYLLATAAVIGIATLVAAGKGSPTHVIACAMIGGLYLLVGYKKPVVTQTR